MSFININLKWCKACGICVDLCPKKVLRTNEKDYPKVNDETKCTECRLCELRCPDFAIEIKEEVNV
jgi:2-oxoglutarate ferredoxin oxidoreductase subunit delta